MKAEFGERLKPRGQYVEDAIELAIEGKWADAAELNNFVIEKFGPDEQTCNRLGKAYIELGMISAALGAYRRALELNPLNIIARKNVPRLEALVADKTEVAAAHTGVDPNLFVEEAGKTVTTTIEVDIEDICNKVSPGDLASVELQGNHVQVKTVKGIELGRLEPDLSHRVVKLVNGGNRYQAVVTACDEGVVRLIVREVYQDARFSGKPSFPVRRRRELDYRPYTKESLFVTEMEPLSFGDGDPDDGDPEGDMQGLHTVDVDLEEALGFEAEAEREDDDDLN